MNRTIGILAHADAGKTTLSEQILCLAGVLRAPGRVDHQDAFMDSDAMERRRGITIFSGQAVFALGENRYTLLDTPGHADFSAEMERALQALDAAILVVSCVEGVQSHTETIWRLARRAGLPAFFFPEILRQYFINHPQSIDKYTFLQNSAFTHWVKEKCSKMC